MRSITSTDIIVIYIATLADETIVRKVKDLLQYIKIDEVFEFHYIEDCFEDHLHFPFPTALTTERSDKMVENLLEGKIGLLLNGSPFALIVPVGFVQFQNTITKKHILVYL